MSDPLDPVRKILSEPEEVDLPEDLGPPAEVPGGPGGPGDDGPPPNDPQDPGPQPDEPAPEIEAAKLPLNDIGNGWRFALYFKDGVIWVPRVGWFAWDGTRWAKDPDDLQVRRFGQSVSQRMLKEVPHAALDDWQMRDLAALAPAEHRERELRPIAERTAEQETELAALAPILKAGRAAREMLAKRRGEYRTFAKSTGNTGKIDAMLKEAGISLARPVDALDADPLAINTLGGTLQFHVEREKDAFLTASMHLRPHERGDLLTKCMPVQYAQGAICPGFDRFLERIQPDPVMRGFLQRTFGLAMTSLTVQRMWFFHGAGANGKSVLVDLMARMLGDYAAAAKIESLTGQSKRSGSEATPDLVHLVGARMVRASEPEQGEKLKEGTIKELTGGEPILVRALHSDFVEVHPRFKLIISGNHKPEIRGTDDGIWRRLLLVPFEVQIPEAERDPDLGAKLWLEAPGILNWMIDGLIDYLERGLQVPQAVTDATREYREDSDPVGLFLDQCCEVTGDAETFTRTKELVEAMNYWLDERGDSTWQPRTIQLKLKTHAGRWRDPRTGRTFAAAKRSIAGYQGLALSAMFRQRWDDARRNAGSSPPSSSASPHPDYDF